MKLRSLSVACAIALVTPVIAMAGDVDIGKLYRGDFRVDQNKLSNMSRDEIRLAGMRMFTNPFVKDDGFGDGDDNPPSPSLTGNHEGERGTLQNNGTFQRINGLDAQTCLECHSIISRRTVPMKFGIGGVGGVNNTVLGAGGGTHVDLQGDKKTNINGRVINPPFIFGAGGIELLANEMTLKLQAQIRAAKKGGDGVYPLRAKGVSFGSIRIADGVIDASEAKGTFDLDPNSDDFMVVAPFGRKGDAKSTRTFDIGALSFHFGMGVNPFYVEDGKTVEDKLDDHDGDDVPNEVTVGELSALSVFVGTAQTPFATEPNAKARRGRRIMKDIGCTECHIPKMQTHGKILGFRSPEEAQNPLANVHTTVNLTKKPMNFKENARGGITIPLFADLKRHYMGENLENFAGDGMFTTMRLWGVADTAPYLHDGRALTIRDAITTHGLDPASEAYTAVNNFNGRSPEDQEAILAFLDTLRSPNGTFPHLLDIAEGVAEDQGVK